MDIRNSAYFRISINEFWISVNELRISVIHLRISKIHLRISEIPQIFGYWKIASCLNLLEKVVPLPVKIYSEDEW